MSCSSCLESYAESAQIEIAEALRLHGKLARVARTHPLLGVINPSSTDLFTPQFYDRYFKGKIPEDQFGSPRWHQEMGFLSLYKQELWDELRARKVDVDRGGYPSDSLDRFFEQNRERRVSALPF